MDLSSLFGSATPTNNTIVDYQKREADDHARRIEELQLRRQNADAQIDAIFGGGTFQPLDWTAMQNAETANKTAWDDYQAALNEWQASQTSNSGFNPTQWFFGNVASLFPADENAPGKPVLPEGVMDPREWQMSPIYGDAVTYTGIGDDFYNAYRNSIMDYYVPQLDRNYRDASGQTMLDFARKGTRKSSAAGEQQGDLRRDYDLQYGSLAGSADEQTAQMRAKIDAEKFGLKQLAASSENPTIAVSQALSEVNAVQPAPSMSPLGDLFNAAAIGYNSYQDARDRQAFYHGYDQPRPGGTTSAGRTYGG